MATIVRCDCGAEYKRTEEKFLVPHTGDAVCTVCGAALESWWNSTHIPSRSIFSLMARERTACSVRFNCIPISRALTSVSANERSHSSSSGVHGLIFFPAAVIAALFLRLQPQLYKPADAIISI